MRLGLTDRLWTVEEVLEKRLFPEPDRPARAVGDLLLAAGADAGAAARAGASTEVRGVGGARKTESERPRGGAAPSHTQSCGHNQQTGAAPCGAAPTRSLLQRNLPGDYCPR